MIWLAIALAGECALDGPMDAGLTESLASADHAVHVVISVPAEPAARPVLDALAQRELAGAVWLGADADDPAYELATSLRKSAHAVVLVPSDAWRASESPDPDQALLALAGEVKTVRKRIGQRPRAVAAPISGKLDEAVLARAGFRAILAEPGLRTGRARESAYFRGQSLKTSLLPAGPYLDGCEGTSHVERFTPAAADRATRAVREAARGEGPQVVRVAIDAPDPEGAQVLARWLDDVILPAGHRVVPPTALLDRVVSAPAPAPTEEVPVGRPIAVADAVAIAEALRDVHTIPRRLPTDLNPTEAFALFAVMLTTPPEGDIARVQWSVRGPRAAATSTLTGPVDIDRAQLVATLQALVVTPPQALPAALPVGGRLLTAGELLLAMASAVRGDDPIRTHPVEVPEPHEVGIGWGDVE